MKLAWCAWMGGMQGDPLQLPGYSGTHASLLTMMLGRLRWLQLRHAAVRA